ncbi:MAG: replicative DNA helicase [Betaproteobacteria bacterium]|nr:replicative DNA helicase [Betaproteobacteria bacterium]
MLRLPPYSVESEQSVIGGLLIDNSAWDRIADVVSGEDFYRDDHRRIFGHIRRLMESNKPADVITVYDEIEKSNEVDQTGGLAYLAEVANHTPSAANIKRYAETVADKALRRKLIVVGAQVQELAWASTGDAKSAVEEAQGMFQPLEDVGRSKSEPRSLSSVLVSAIEIIEQNMDRKGGYTGVPSGFYDIDAKLNGMAAGDLIILAGRPSMGKSTLGMNIAENVALDGGSVAVFSLEMGDVQLAMRTISSVSGVDFGDVRSGKLNNEQWDKIGASLGQLHQAGIVIDETSGLSVAQIAARSRRIKRKAGKLDLIVIDYLQLITPPRSVTANNRNDEVTAISAGLKKLAKEMACPVLCLSQLSRRVEERADKRPLMSDLRDSGAIEQDADVIMMMYRDEYYNENTQWKGMAEVDIAKHRNGETGMVRMVFQGNYCRFRNADHAVIAAMEHTEREKKESDKKPAKRGFND